MSVDKPRRTRTIWDIVFDEQVPDASLDASLIAFNKHKETLLDMLGSKHERGSKSKPFDADQSWRDLSNLAELYFWEAKIKPEARPASDPLSHITLRRFNDFSQQWLREYDYSQACLAPRDP